MDTIQIAPNEPQEPFEHRFSTVIGSGHFGLALYERTLRHLEMAHRRLGVQYLRCHGLLSGWPDLCSWVNQSSAGLEPELGFDPDQLAGEGPFQVNFAFTDLVIDRLLEIGIRPFVEIGFMPRILASSSHTLTRWNANTCPPRDYGLWEELIERLMTHWVRRYGGPEVQRWYFEVWNEPNLDGFWPATMEEYFRLYERTVRTIKTIDPALRVGGPATAGRTNAHIYEFLRFCASSNTPVDFVTSHSYADHSTRRDGEFTYHGLKPPTFLPDRFREMRAEIDASPIPNLPLHITEYNSTTSTREILHDLPVNAAYLARTLSEAGQYADSFSYWAVSDVFCEEGIPPAEFHGGFGLINLHDVPKPTFHLFEFFHELGDRLLSRTDRSIFTVRKDGHLVGVLWNPKTDGENDDRSFRISVNGGIGPYISRMLTVDEEHGNPYRLWCMLGRERNPRPEQVARLQEASRPECRYGVAGRPGQADLEVTLGRNAIMLVDLVPVEKEPVAYVGLDEKSYSSVSV